jgi:hypothetical protein
VTVNVFSWGIGGEAHRNNFFRRATENPEAPGAYAKSLRGETMVESAATGFSAGALQEKMHQIQTELPGSVQEAGQHGRVMPLMQKLQSLVKETRELQPPPPAKPSAWLIRAPQKRVGSYAPRRLCDAMEMREPRQERSGVP